MNVLFLTNNSTSEELFRWLKEREAVVVMRDIPLDLEFLNEVKPDIIVSYNYKYIIKKEVIDYMKGNIINLHISFLPWNRGASPNFWSFIEDTPKGVTIHYIDEGVDTGDIIVQKECYFEEEIETFSSTYEILNKEIMELFKENWEAIKMQKCGRKKQIVPYGTCHRTKDLQKIQQEIDFSWNDTISDVKNKIQCL